MIAPVVRKTESDDRARRIVISTGIFPPDSGGPASYVPVIAKALVSRGHDVTVLCLSDQPAFSGDQQYPFDIVRVPRQAFKPLRWSRTVLRLCQLLRNADILYVNGLGSESALAAYMSRVPAVHKVVGDYAWERARNRDWFRDSLDHYQTARKGPALRTLDLIRSVPIRTARSVVVPSKYLERLVCGWRVSRERVRVVYNAIEESRPATSENPLPVFDGKTVITVCRLVAWKGVQGILEALAPVTKTRLVVLGDGPLRETLTTRARELRMEDRALFLGHVSSARLVSYLQQADVMVLNSTYEGLPHVVLEAMAVGLPVVATAVGGTVEVVHDERTGLLVPTDDHEALRSAIHRVLEDRDLVSRVTDGARELIAERFRLSEMLDTTESILLAASDTGRSR